MATSTSYPPRLQLSPQTNATSIKRSFDELGLDEISSADEQASGSGTSHSSTGNAEGSNDRNKRARSESDSSGVDEIDEIFVASNGSYSSSSGLMGGRDIAVVSSNSLQAALSVNATDLSTNPVPPNTSNVGVENPDIEMEDMLPFVFRAISPPNVPPPRTPHSDANEQYRLSLERFNDFDREISALRRAPFSPALASILDQGDVIASTGYSSAEDRPAIHPSSSASGSTLVTDSQVSVSTRSCPVSHSLDATPSTFSYPLWPLHSHEDRSVPFGSMPFAARARRRVARMSPSEDDTIAASWLDTSSTDAQPRSTSQYLRQMERTYVDRLRLIRERRNAFPDATEPIDDEDSLNSTLRFRSRNAVDRFPEVSLRAPGEHRSHLASLDRPSDTFFPQTGPEDAGPTRPFFPYNRVASPSTRSSERDGNSASRPLASYVLPESRFSTLANALSSPVASEIRPHAHRRSENAQVPQSSSRMSQQSLPHRRPVTVVNVDSDSDSEDLAAFRRRLRNLEDHPLQGRERSSLARNEATSRASPSAFSRRQVAGRTEESVMPDTNVPVGHESLPHIWESLFMESPQGVADPLRTSGNLRPADSSRPAASSTFTLAANRDAHQGSSLASNPYFYTTRPGPSNSLMSESAAERRRRISQDAIFSHRFGSNASGVDMSGGSHADPTTRRMLSFDPETDQPASHSSLQRSAVFHQLRWPWDQVANELQTNSASVPSQHIDGYIPSRRALPGGNRRLRDDEDISPFGLPHELSNPSGDQSNASEVALSFDDLSSYPSGRDFDRDYYSMEMDSSNSHASFGRSARSANPPSSRVAEHPLPYSSIVTDIPPWGQIMNDPSLESSSHADRVAYEDEGLQAIHRRTTRLAQLRSVRGDTISQLVPPSAASRPRAFSSSINADDEAADFEAIRHAAARLAELRNIHANIASSHRAPPRMDHSRGTIGINPYEASNPTENRDLYSRDRTGYDPHPGAELQSFLHENSIHNVPSGSSSLQLSQPASLSYAPATTNSGPHHSVIDLAAYREGPFRATLARSIQFDRMRSSSAHQREAVSRSSESAPLLPRPSLVSNTTYDDGQLPPMRTYPDVWPETSIDIGERSDARPNSSDAFLRHAILRRRLPVRNLNQRNDPQLSNASSIREEEMRLHHTITRRSIPEVSRLAAGLPMSASAVWTSQPHPADVFHHRERTENQLRSTQLWGEMDVETFPSGSSSLALGPFDGPRRRWQNRRDSTPRLFAFPNDPTLAGGHSGGSTHRADTLPPLRRGRAQSISPSRDSARTSSTSSLAASSAAARSLRMRALRRRPSDLMGLDQTSDVSRLGGYRSFVSARTRHIGDYMRDEDLDTSYEGLLRLSTFLGEVGPRGTPDHVVSSLPNGLYKDWAKPGETDERCPICLDDYAPTDPVLKIPGCSHWFHKTCLEKWLKTARSCPVCRGRVATQQQTRSVAGPSGSGGASRRVRIVDLMQDDSSEDEDGDITPRRRSTPPPPWRS